MFGFLEPAALGARLQQFPCLSHNFSAPRIYEVFYQMQVHILEMETILAPFWRSPISNLGQI